MIYFVDDNKWDIAGYYENLKKISRKLGDYYNFFGSTSLHDFELCKLELLKNDFEILSNIYILNPYEDKSFQIIWHDISDYQVSYKASDYCYANTGEVITNDGYGSIAEDEITEYNEQLLKHEILLTSKMRIVVIAKTIEVKQIDI